MVHDSIKFNKFTLNSIVIIIQIFLFFYIIFDSPDYSNIKQTGKYLNVYIRRNLIFFALNIINIGCLLFFVKSMNKSVLLICLILSLWNTYFWFYLDYNNYKNVFWRTSGKAYIHCLINPPDCQKYIDLEFNKLLSSEPPQN